MADQQPLNATFFAFKKRDRAVLLPATLVYAVLASVIFALFAWLNWQAVVDYINWAASMSQSAENADPKDPSAVFGAMMPPASVMNIFPSYFLLLLILYLLLAAYEAACLRWMIRGETGGLFGLALNADTLRVYFTYWLWYFLLLALYFVIALLAIGVGVGVMLGAQGNPESAGPLAVLMVVLFIVALILALIYFAVRFAPAAATSIAKRRFAFFDAWTVTRGRFWPLFGSFVLLFVMYFVGIMILSGVATFAMVGGLMSQAQTAPEPQSIEEVLAMFAAPTVWIPMTICYGLMIVGAFVFYLALFGVNARAAQAALEEGRIQAEA